jgi:hypothetical protein
MDLVRRSATREAPRIAYDPSKRERPLALERGLTYFGFALEREREPLDDFTPALAPQIRRVLAEALARGEARHQAVPRNRQGIDEVREVWRRSGGATPRLQQADLAAWYEGELAEVHDLQGFRAASLRFDPDRLVSREERARWMALPGAVEIRDRTIALHYEVEESPEGGARGVVRLQLPEKVARTLVEEELPLLDRPLRFVVTRGARGSVRGDSLAEVQEALRQPWSQEERPSRGGRGAREGRGARDGRVPGGGGGGGRGDGRGPRRGPPGPKGRGGRRHR